MCLVFSSVTWHPQGLVEMYILWLGTLTLGPAAKIDLQQASSGLNKAYRGHLSARRLSISKRYSSEVTIKLSVEIVLLVVHAKHIRAEMPLQRRPIC